MWFISKGGDNRVELLNRHLYDWEIIEGKVRSASLLRKARIIGPDLTPVRLSDIPLSWTPSPQNFHHDEKSVMPAPLLYH